jgi:hypothetical protein
MIRFGLRYGISAKLTLAWLGFWGLTGCSSVDLPPQSEVVGFIQRSSDRPPLKLVNVEIVKSLATADNKQVEYETKHEYEVTEDVLVPMPEKEVQPLVGAIWGTLREHEVKMNQLRFPETEQLRSLSNGMSRTPPMYRVTVNAGTKVKFDGSLVGKWEGDRGWRFSRMFVNWADPFIGNQALTKGSIRGEFFVWDTANSKASLGGFRQRMNTYIASLDKVYEAMQQRLKQE